MVKGFVFALKFYSERFLAFFIRVFVPMRGSKVLLVQAGGLGDMAVATAVLKNYQRYFGEGNVYIVTHLQNQARNVLGSRFAGRVIEIDQGRFKRNPLYAAKNVIRLRKIGFGTVIYNITNPISLCHSSFFIAGLDARQTVGYEGERFYLDVGRKENPYHRFLIKFMLPKILDSFSFVVPSMPASLRDGGILPSAIAHQKKILEDFTGRKFDDYSTEAYFDGSKAGEGSGKMPKEKFFICHLGAGHHKLRWPVERYVGVSKMIEKEFGLVPVLTGMSAEEGLAERYLREIPDAISFVGKTDFSDLEGLIKGSSLVISNDTGMVHLAVALKKPSFCILGAGEVGRLSHYGYQDINRWVYDRNAGCFLDNFRCGNNAKDLYPCIDSITEQMVEKELEKFLRRLLLTKDVPREAFCYQ